MRCKTAAFVESWIWLEFAVHLMGLMQVQPIGSVAGSACRVPDCCSHQATCSDVCTVRTVQGGPFPPNGGPWSPRV